MRSIRLKLLLALATVGVLAVLLTAWLTAEQASRALRESASRQLAALRDGRAQALSTALQLLGANLAAAAAEPMARRALDAGAGDGAAGVPAQLPARLRELAERLRLDDVMLADRDGRPVLQLLQGLGSEAAFEREGAPRRLLAAVLTGDGATRDSGLSALGSGALFCDFVLLPEAGGRPRAFVAAPVRRGGEIRGALVGRVPPERFEESVSAEGTWSREVLGESGDVYLLGTEGLLRSTPRSAIAGGGAGTRTRDAGGGAAPEEAPGPGVLLRSGPTVRAAWPAQPAEPGLAASHAEGGVEALVAWAPVRGSPGWVLVTQKELAEVEAPARAVMRSAALWTLPVLLLVVLVSFLLSGRLTRPIRRVTDAARAIGEGRLGVRVPVRGQDELGRLAEAFNDMASRVESAHWSLEEANRRLTERNTLLRRETGEQRDRLETLSRFAEELSRIQDLDIVLSSVLTEARRLTSADAGSVYQLDGNLLVVSFSQNDTLAAHGEARDLMYTRLRLPLTMNSIAGAVALTGEPLNLPDVRSIPADAPYQFNRAFDDATGYVTRAMLTVPLRTEAAGTVGVVQLINPRSAEGQVHGFTPADERLMANFAGLAGIAIERAQLTRSIILRMIGLAEVRDPTETGPHVNRVAEVAMRLYDGWAQAHGVEPDVAARERDDLRMAAMLHDVGKVAVPDAVLRKQGPLTDEERLQMQQHVLVGARLFSGWQTPLDRAARDVALFHHARWDGSGYPTLAQLTRLAEEAGRNDLPVVLPKGNQIPLFARITSVADVFDALASRRSYKEAWAPQRILETIRAEAGRSLDPELVQIFERNFEELLAVRNLYPGDVPDVAPVAGASATTA
ncbi:MAG: HAMP domain-containing protein [Phycisphaerales bacterium]